MIDKPIDEITKADIEALVENEVPEGRTLDYKATLIGHTDDDKKEFLADACSFANSTGGDLLFGVRERVGADGKNTGIPEMATGLSGLNSDAEILTLHNLMRDGVEPPIRGAQLRPISGFPEGPVLLLRIPQSWNTPHMIKLKMRPAFYARNSAGKYPLDIQEIRQAFALSEALPEKVRGFRADRLARILADDTPVPLAGDARWILHIYPASAAVPTYPVDMVSFDRFDSNLQPVYHTGNYRRLNLDGCLSHTNLAHAGRCTGYVQLFRTGCIETVDGQLSRGPTGQGSLPIIPLQQYTIKALSNYMALLKSCSVSPPLFIMLSLVGVKNYELGLDPSRFSPRQPIDRDALLVPEVIVEDYEGDPATVLRPAFDAVWQAADWERSLGYDTDGKWVGL